MLSLRQSTVVEVPIGPAVAVGDGFTPVTTLTIAAADDKRLIKHGATTSLTLAGTLAVYTAAADGHYHLDLSASETDTLGHLTVIIQDDSLILPLVQHFMVMPANVFDSLHGSDKLQIDQREIVGTTVPTPTTAGMPDVNVERWRDTLAAVLAAAGRVDVSTNAIGGDVITASAIAATALNGKGDWNIGKTGYTLTQGFPTNFSAMSITAGGLADITQAAADKAFGASGAGLAELAVGIPDATPSPRAALMLLYMALRNKLDVTTAIKRVHNDAGTIVTTKALTDDGSTYSEAEMISG